MINRENLEQVKEQLRIKNVELKKTNAEKNRQEVKIKHLLAVTGKKINTLQQQLNEKKEQIRLQKSISYQRSTTISSSGKKSALSPTTTGPTPGGSPELELAGEINQMLKELREKNSRLTQKIEGERKSKERLADEKGVLTREIRRLQSGPKPSASLKTQADHVDKLDDESRERFEQLVKEKEDLIKTYEKLLDGDFEEGDESQFPAEVVKQIRKELTAIKSEKDELERELVLQKKKFKLEMDYEVKKAEESAGKKLKRTVSQEKNWPSSWMKRKRTIPHRYG